ncbi:hypothetical protein ACFL3W_01040 [Pseudomonadota bacterium]
MEIILVGIALLILFALFGLFKSNKCPDCKGSGYGPTAADQPPNECLKCNGIGRVVK